MKTFITKAAAILALGAGVAASSQAASLTYQGVTFTSTWSGKLLTLEIDAPTAPATGSRPAPSAPSSSRTRAASPT